MFYKKLKNTEANVNLIATSVENYEFINYVVKVKNEVHSTLLDYRCLNCYDIVKIDKITKFIFPLNKSENNFLVKYYVCKLNLFIIMHKDFYTFCDVYSLRSVQSVLYK